MNTPEQWQAATVRWFCYGLLIGLALLLLILCC